MFVPPAPDRAAVETPRRDFDAATERSVPSLFAGHNAALERAQEAELATLIDTLLRSVDTPDELEACVAAHHNDENKIDLNPYRPPRGEAVRQQVYHQQVAEWAAMRGAGIAVSGRGATLHPPRSAGADDGVVAIATPEKRPAAPAPSSSGQPAPPAGDTAALSVVGSAVPKPPKRFARWSTFGGVEEEVLVAHGRGDEESLGVGIVQPPSEPADDLKAPRSSRSTVLLSPRSSVADEVAAHVVDRLWQDVVVPSLCRVLGPDSGVDAVASTDEAPPGAAVPQGSSGERRSHQGRASDRDGSDSGRGRPSRKAPRTPGPGSTAKAPLSSAGAAQASNPRVAQYVSEQVQYHARDPLSPDRVGAGDSADGPEPPVAGVLPSVSRKHRAQTANLANRRQLEALLPSRPR